MLKVYRPPDARCQGSEGDVLADDGIEGVQVAMDSSDLSEEGFHRESVARENIYSRTMRHAVPPEAALEVDGGVGGGVLDQVHPASFV